MEVELRCEAEKCIFNTREICTAPEIHVNGEDTMGGRFTYCNTFSVDDDGVEALKVPDNLNSEFFESSPLVQCSAQNCIYNEGEECHAPHVKILSGVATAPVQTECETFFPRQGQTS